MELKSNYKLMKVMLCSMKVVVVFVEVLCECNVIGSSDVNQIRGPSTPGHSKRFVPGSLVGIKDIDFVGRSDAETP